MPGPVMVTGPAMEFSAFCDGAEGGAGGASGLSPDPELPSASGGPPI